MAGKKLHLTMSLSKTKLERWLAAKMGTKAANLTTSEGVTGALHRFLEENDVETNIFKDSCAYFKRAGIDGNNLTVEVEGMPPDFDKACKLAEQFSP